MLRVDRLFNRYKDFEEGWLKMARIEYTKQYDSLKSALGREPTGRELRDYIG